MAEADTSRRGEEPDEAPWPSHETATAFQWLSNQEALYTEAVQRVSRAGSFHAGADALQEWIETENPLAEAEPSLYTDLLSTAIAGIAWDDLAEAFAPDAWMQDAEPVQEEPPASKQPG